MRIRLCALLTALFASGAAVADSFPCGIASIKPLRGTVEVRFTGQAYWYFTASQLQYISVSKIIVNIEDGKNFPSVEADALHVPDGQQLRSGFHICLAESVSA